MRAEKSEDGSAVQVYNGQNGNADAEAEDDEEDVEGKVYIHGMGKSCDQDGCCSYHSNVGVGYCKSVCNSAGVWLHSVGTCPMEIAAGICHHLCVNQVVHEIFEQEEEEKEKPVDCPEAPTTCPTGILGGTLSSSPKNVLWSLYSWPFAAVFDIVVTLDERCPAYLCTGHWIDWTSSEAEPTFCSDCTEGQTMYKLGVPNPTDKTPLGMDVVLQGRINYPDKCRINIEAHDRMTIRRMRGCSQIPPYPIECNHDMIVNGELNPQTSQMWLGHGRAGGTGLMYLMNGDKFEDSFICTTHTMFSGDGTELPKAECIGCDVGDTPKNLYVVPANSMVKIKVSDECASWDFDELVDVTNEYNEVVGKYMTQGSALGCSA